MHVVRWVAAVFSTLSLGGAQPPPRTLPFLPSIGRVRFVAGRDRLVVSHDINLPRGDYRGEPLDLYVAFGAPGLPSALDAQLLPVADGALEAADTQRGESLRFERASRRPPTAYPLLGRDSMAGVVVHVGGSALARALAPGNMAVVRIRTVIEVVTSNPKTAVVRLGAVGPTPLTLGRVTLEASGGRIEEAEVRLCGPEADALPLSMKVPRLARPVPQRIAPVLAVRHPSDDLCLSYALKAD